MCIYRNRNRPNTSCGIQSHINKQRSKLEWRLFFHRGVHLPYPNQKRYVDWKHTHRIWYVFFKCLKLNSFILDWAKMNARAALNEFVTDILLNEALFSISMCLVFGMFLNTQNSKFLLWSMMCCCSLVFLSIHWHNHNLFELNSLQFFFSYVRKKLNWKKNWNNKKESSTSTFGKFIIICIWFFSSVFILLCCSWEIDKKRLQSSDD